MRIAITGANSFLGKRMVQKAYELGWDIDAVVRNGTPRFLNLDDKHIRIHYIDMADYSELGKELKNIDCFVHFAWNGTRGSTRLDESKQRNNYFQSIEGIKSVIESGCNRILLAGSQAEYGLNYGKMTEDTECNPNTAYGKYKYKLYVDTSELCKREGVSIKEARLFSIYGPGDYSKTMIMECIENMISDKPCFLTEGMQEWDYLYVDDTIKAFSQLCECDCPDGAYNLGSGDHRCLRSYIEEMKEILGSSSELQFGAIPYGPAGIVSINPSIEKIKEETGWKPETSFFTGITTIINSISRKEEQK